MVVGKVSFIPIVLFIGFLFVALHFDIGKEFLLLQPQTCVYILICGDIYRGENKKKRKKKKEREKIGKQNKCNYFPFFLIK